jgi:hypothetical protein
MTQYLNIFVISQEEEYSKMLKVITLTLLKSNSAIWFAIMENIWVNLTKYHSNGN